jgi:hypothetical protein
MVQDKKYLIQSDPYYRARLLVKSNLEAVNKNLVGYGFVKNPLDESRAEDLIFSLIEKGEGEQLNKILGNVPYLLGKLDPEVDKAASEALSEALARVRTKLESIELAPVEYKVYEGTRSR